MKTYCKNRLVSDSITAFPLFNPATSTKERRAKGKIPARNTCAIALLLGLVVGTAQPAPAQYDPSAQFSPVANPNSDWSYGFETVPLGSPFNLFTLASPIPASPGPPIASWLSAPVGTFLGVFDNGTAAAQTVTTGASETSLFQPGMLAMNAGPNDEYAMVLFTAPANGMYTIQGTFEGIDTGSTVSTVYLLENNVPFASASVTGFGPGSDKTLASGPILLGAGQTLAYAVGGISSDSMTALINAQVSAAAVPEPSTYALLGLALLPLAVRGGFVRNRKAAITSIRPVNEVRKV